MLLKHSDPSTLYLKNRVFDFLSMGGLSLITFVLLYVFQNAATNAANHAAIQAKLLSFSITLLWFCNWPHFSATLQRLYRSPTNLKQYPWTSFGLPCVVLAGLFLSLQFPKSAGTAIVKLYTLWAPYHFSGQSVGIALLYARRAEIQIEQWERKALSLFIFSTFYFMVARGESLPWTQSFVGLSYSSLALPAWFSLIFQIGFYLSTVLYICVFFNPLKPKSLPPIFHLPAISQFLWFVIGPHYPGFYQLVPFFHSLQYLPIVWLLSLNESQEIAKPRPVWRDSMAFIRANIIGGAVLFWALPILLTFFGYPKEITKPLVFAWINLHHFVIDGVIWKLKNPTVSRPLLRSIPPLGLRVQVPPTRTIIEV